MLKKFAAKIGINRQNDRLFDPSQCHDDCIVKLLFRNVKHYHVTDYNGYNNIFIDNEDGIIDGLVPYLRAGYKGDKTKFWTMLGSCVTLDQYIQLRRKLTKDKSIFEPRTDLKYNIQYGLPYSLPKIVKSKTKSKNMKKKNDNKSWSIVGKKTQETSNKLVTKDVPQQINIVRSNPIEKDVSWASHLKKIYDSKN